MPSPKPADKPSTSPPQSGQVAAHIEDGDRLRVLDHVEGGIAVCQSDAFLYANEPLLRMLGYPSVEALAKVKVSDVASAAYDAWVEKTAAGVPQTESWRCADGSELRVDVLSATSTMQGRRDERAGRARARSQRQLARPVAAPADGAARDHRHARDGRRPPDQQPPRVRHREHQLPRGGDPAVPPLPRADRHRGAGPPAERSPRRDGRTRAKGRSASRASSAISGPSRAWRRTVTSSSTSTRSSTRPRCSSRASSRTARSS